MPSSEDVSDLMKEHWHLDKKVPLALILTMFVQTAGIFWWAATTTERLATVERRLEITAPQADRLTRVEVKVDNILDSLNRIETIARSPR